MGGRFLFAARIFDKEKLVTELRLYDSLRRSVQPFRPRVPGVATVYSCGPTVYSRQHLGNMRPYVFADLLTRARIPFTRRADGMPVLT